jgi:ubiquinone/menaquinone biosynthesis C-methylase UbiE
MTDRVELRRGDIQVLDLPDATVDTVVSTYTFCTFPKPSAGPS